VDFQEGRVFMILIAAGVNYYFNIAGGLSDTPNVSLSHQDPAHAIPSLS
jgi:hypothetical protein